MWWIITAILVLYILIGLLMTFVCIRCQRLPFIIMNGAEAGLCIFVWPLALFVLIISFLEKFGEWYLEWVEGLPR